ncbi:FecR family protein [Parabacteroides merdae]|uniref:FecR family protein n=2 Tax=Parabacteroides merdae TaxID=46503 RepID=UPI0034A37707
MKRFYCFLVAAILFCACSEDWKNGKRLGEKPVLFPDYAQTTIPYNIAPLNFTVRADGCRVSVLLEAGVVKFKVEAPDGKVRIPEKKWKRLLQEAKDDSVRVTVARKKGDRWEIWQPVSLNVAADPVDPYLVYRLIEPGYALWNKMGIYQRGMESFDETTVYENKMTDYNCVNCHSFCGHDPDKMLFHLRAKLAGTVLVDGDEVELLDTKTDKTISAFTYPYWHPSGRYIAFSINRTTQQLHSTQRTEVYDTWTKERNVRLDGEAYFEVAADPDRLFVVEGGGVVVKVHGTVFNMKAREKQDHVDVSLLSGLVVVENHGVSRSLNPGETAVCKKSVPSIEKKTTDVSISCLWAKESLRFEKKTIYELTGYLSEWYGMDIRLDPSLPTDQAYTFTITHESLEEVLCLIAKITPIEYVFDEDNTVRITRK